MAQIPNQEEITKAQQETEAAIAEKTEAQRAEGKDFIVTDNGHGPGVMPEDVWAKYKEQSNG